MNLKKILKKEIYSFQYKAEPMAMLVYLQKKIKRMDTLELAKLYNEKCFGLYDQMDHLREEIETYKDVIEELKMKLSEKSTEIEHPLEKKLSMITNYDNETKTQDRITTFVKKPSFLRQSSRFFVDNDIKDKELKELKETNETLKEEIATLKEENFNLKQSLSKALNESKENKDTLIKLQGLKKKSSGEMKINEMKEKLDQIILENLFLMYLLDRSLNYEKIIKQINSNFEFYFNLFVCDKKDINILSSILYEFIYRIHKKANIEALSEEIFLSNSITKGEDYNIAYTKNEFLSTSILTEDLILQLNKRVNNYRNDSITEINILLNNCFNIINTEPSLENLRKFEVTSVYTISSKGKLKINCTKLTNDTVLFLVNTIKYYTEEIKIIEFNGDIRDKDITIDSYMKVVYNLKTYFGAKILYIIFDSMTNMTDDYITNCFNKLFVYVPNMIKLSIIRCRFTDYKLGKINLKTNEKIQEIDLSSNKLESLSYFDNNNFICDSVILKNNPLKFRSGDNKIPFKKLDLSNNDFDEETMNQLNNHLKNSSISWFNFSNNAISQDIAILLGNSLENFPQLKKLYLNNIGLTEECTPLVLHHLSKILIEEIYLNDNNLGEIGSLIIVSLLKNNNSIKKLELARCNIGPISIKPLVEQIALKTNITEINLTGNNFENEEVKELLDKMKVVI